MQQLDLTTETQRTQRSGLGGLCGSVVTLEFVPFRAGHLTALRLQAAQAWLQPLLARPEYGTALMGPDTWTGIIGDRVVGCAGVLPQWPGRAIAWALLTRDLTARHFLRAHHKVLQVLQSAQRAGTRRIETTVDAGFDAGHRWARALGFRPEGLMRGYSPEGRDHVLYARIHDAASAFAKQSALQPIVNAVSREQALSPEFSPREALARTGLGETPSAREEGGVR